MKRLNLFLIGIVLIFVQTLQGCGSSDPDTPTKPVAKFNVTLNPAVTYQTISGFGGANQMWGSQFPSAADMKKAFGTDENDLGMSLFRIRISSNTSEWPLIVDVAKEAMKYDVKILASPWSPPPSLKSNNSDVRGHLLEENYGEYVDHINAFIDLMTDNGVELYAISIQNEPDWEATYESCDWTAGQMRKFLIDHGGDINPAIKVAAPESLNFSQTFTNTLLNDDDAAKNFDIAAGHLYGGGLGSFPVAEQKGKEIWMTEYLLNLNVGDWEGAEEATKWDETIEMLNSIHGAMSYNWNAYIWWYLKRYYSFIGDGDEGTTNGVVLKRGKAFSHYSKFVRPGYTRIDVQEDKNTGLNITAYEGDGKLVVVIVNPKDAAIADVGISASGKALSSASSYTSTLLLDKSFKQLEMEDSKVVVSALGKSVTTIVFE